MEHLLTIVHEGFALSPQTLAGGGLTDAFKRAAVEAAGLGEGAMARLGVVYVQMASGSGADLALRLETPVVTPNWPARSVMLATSAQKIAGGPSVSVVASIVHVEWFRADPIGTDPHRT